MRPEVSKNRSVFIFRVTEDEGTTILPTTQRHISEDFNAESKAKYGNNII